MDSHQFSENNLLAMFVMLIITCLCVPASNAITLAYRGMVQDEIDGVDGLYGATSTTISPDGRHVYATGHYDDALAVFSRNSETGQMAFVETQKDGINGVDGLDGASIATVSSDGKHVYATGYYDDAIVVFSRNSETGQLTFVEMQQDGVNGVDGLDGSHAVAVSPDGKHLYTAAWDDGAVAVFNRDSDSGQLTFVEAKKDGNEGIDGLLYAAFVVVSPDGKHLYAAGRGDNAVVVFSRDSDTGQLTFVEMQQDGVSGVNGLDGPHAVAVSPDGKHLYASGFDDNAVIVFSRDSSTGQLIFVEMQQDGFNGVDGIYEALSVIVSPDGQHLFASGLGEDAIAVFIRDRNTGKLTFAERQKDGVEGVDGLFGPSFMAVSPDGMNLYAPGDGDNSIAIFTKCFTQADLDTARKKRIVPIMF